MRDSLGLISSLVGETGDDGGPGLLLKPNICCGVETDPVSGSGKYLNCEMWYSGCLLKHKSYVKSAKGAVQFYI